MARAKADDSGESRIARRRKAARAGSTKGYEDRKRALLGAAAEIFQAKGFLAVRMEDVAQELDVDRATLYYYFGNKQQLFREVIREAVTKNVVSAQKIAESDDPARVKLEVLLVSLLDNYDRSHPLLFVYVQEDMTKLATDDSPESQELIKLGDEYELIVKRIIEQGISEGEFQADTSPTLAAYAVIGAANWSHRWFKPNGKLSGAEVGRLFASLFLDGLLVGPARRRARSAGGHQNGSTPN